MRGTQPFIPQITNSQFLRDWAPSRAIGTLARTTTTSAATTGHNKCGFGGKVAAAISTPPLLHHDREVSSETRERNS